MGRPLFIKFLKVVKTCLQVSCSMQSKLVVQQCSYTGSSLPETSIRFTCGSSRTLDDGAVRCSDTKFTEATEHTLISRTLFLYPNWKELRILFCKILLL